VKNILVDNQYARIFDQRKHDNGQTICSKVQINHVKKKEKVWEIPLCKPYHEVRKHNKQW
jgi:hypothetical protein